LSDDFASPCIEGEGARSGGGYHVRRVTIGRDSAVMMFQHRQALINAWGVTPQPGQVVRHACDNPGCVNPLHLMLGTTADNNRDIAERGRHAGQRKTHCPRGHALVEGNLVPSRKWRRCLTCHRAQDRESKARARARARA
jgi:hypothetical protein